MSTFFNSGFEKKQSWFLTDVLKFILLKSTYVFDADHDFVADISSHECPDITGYTGGFNGSGRKALAGRATYHRDDIDTVGWFASNVSWTALQSGQTLASIAVFEEITSDAQSPIIFHLSFTPRVTDGLDFSLVFGPNGLGRMRKALAST